MSAQIGMTQIQLTGTTLPQISEGPVHLLKPRPDIVASMEEQAQTGHPLAELIASAANGQFVPVDGGWQRVPPWRPHLEAIVAFTGHAVLALAPHTSDDLLVTLGVDGFGGAHDPRLIAALAGTDGWIDSLDVLLAGRGTGSPSATPRLVHRPDLAEHPRTKFAAGVRDNLKILGYQDRDRSALAILSRGLAGLRELSFELEPEHRGGGGAALVKDAMSTVPSHQLVVTAVAPGNAASLRALLSAGFTPLGSVQLFRRNG